MRNTRPSLTRTLGVLAILMLGLARPPAAQTTMVSLTIHMSGPNTGTVGVVPIGALCGSPAGTQCVFSVSPGTTLKLAANQPAPSTPGVFSLGTGSAVACATSTCTFTITSNSDVTATFDPGTAFVTMTVNLAGDAGGEVGADNDQCQNYDHDLAHLPTQFSACTTSYAPNSVVSLQARPPVASRFAGYSNGTNNAAGVCAAGPSCSFAVTANASVTATFNALTAIAVSPLSDTIDINQTRLFAANGTFSDGFTEPLVTGQGTWTTKASMNVARFDLAAAVSGGRIYALGGDAPSSCGPSQPPPCSSPSSVVEAYDPTSNTWTAKASMLSPRDGFGAGTIDGRIYAAGGSGPGAVPGSFVATLDVYDPGSDTWTSSAPMPGGPRGFMAAAVVNRKLYAIGGQDAGGVLARVEEFDPDLGPSGTWTTKAPMPTPRRWAAVAVANGIIYAIGGDNAGVSPSTVEGTKVEAYDPATNSWSTKAPLPDGGRTILSAAAVDNVVYAIGGQSGFLRSSVWAYDPVSDSWSSKKFIPALETQIVVGQTLNGARGESAAVSLGGRVYLMGGYTDPATHDPLAVVTAFTDNLIWGTSDPGVATVRNQTGPQAGTATGRHAGTTLVTARTGPLSCGSQCATLTVTSATANVAPTVTIFGSPAGAPALTINAGQSISTGGSFRDPDSGQTWTATVNYGDNSGTQPLALGPGNPPLGPTGTFSLSHQYSTPGTYTAIVTVRDSGGAAGSASLKVTVNGIQNPQIVMGLPGVASTEVFSDFPWGCGSFLDQSAAGGSWSATVDYGDGSGVQPLPLVVPMPATNGCGSGTGMFRFDHAYSAAGSYHVTVTITNNNTAPPRVGTSGFTVNVVDNRCAVVTITVSGNVPFSTIPVTVTAGGQSFEAALTVGTNPIDFHTGEEGTYRVHFNPPAGYRVVPPELEFAVVCGQNVSLSARVELLDTTPPAIASVSPSTGMLWPPNHKMVGVAINVQATDNVDASPVCAIQSVASSEPIDGLGDGDTAPDWLITGPLSVGLRAERAGAGSGRTYTIVVKCSDSAGNVSTKSTQVIVPHDKGK